MKRKPAVIAYDITSNKRRKQALKCLTAWRLAGQYSVFECKLSHAEAEELLLQLTQIIDQDEDKLLFAWLDQVRQAKALTKAASLGFQQAVVYAG